jgi:hypothetical protein
MSELSDEIKSKVINAIKSSAHGSTPINIRNLDKFIKGAVKNMGKSGEGVQIGQTVNGSGASITLTISGLKVAADVMFNIAKRYFNRQYRYMDEAVIPASHYGGDKPTATGQTRGRMRAQNLTDNLELRESYFRFHMPDSERSGDVRKRQATARKNHWREKYHDSQGKPIPSTKLQKGKRKGQNYEPKTFNEVAGYIEQRIGKPIFFTDTQEIKQIVITELVRAMR